MITEKTKAILLFTSYFDRNSNKKLKPLTTVEWNRFARWLQTKYMSPEDLLLKDTAIINDFKDKTIPTERLNALLERKSSLAIALDKWSKAGVWILNRGDKDYPKQVKDKLKDNAPPIFFGIGNIELLNKKYIGVVGSRNATEQELEETKRLALSISKNGYGVVSGGAKGVDESAMIGALEGNGYSLGYLADSLIKKSTLSLFRKFIIDKKLCLLSPYNPEAGFNVGNAMSRNKLIYTQSEATIVMKSDVKGGTWEGALENLKKKWVPIWIIDSNIQGNVQLAKAGAKKLSFSDEINVSNIIRKEPIILEPNLFSSFYSGGTPTEVKHKEAIGNIVNESSIQYSSNKILLINFSHASLFDLFIVKLNDAFKSRAFTKNELKEKFNLTPGQMDEWLKMAIENDYLIKKGRPISFHINPDLTLKLIFD